MNQVRLRARLPQPHRDPIAFLQNDPLVYCVRGETFAQAAGPADFDPINYFRVGYTEVEA